MTRSFWRTLLALAAVAAVLALGACGDDDEDEGGGDTSGTPAQSEDGGNVTEQLFAGSAADNVETPDEGKKGGKLTLLSAGDVDYLDPGKTYYTYTMGVMAALHRGLYAFPPGADEPVPDLAADAAEIAEDGKTVTVKLKPGVMFSKPVSREVTSADVKYAVERAFTTNLANGYAEIYFGDLVGAPEEIGDYKEIPGIETPDDETIVFKLTKGTGAALAGALAMPISVPVPKEFAQKYDKELPSTYGEGHAVYTGPYMVESDAEGKPTGYVAGKSLHIVRNPDYSDVEDFRPAFIDEFEIQSGNEDNSVATRRVLAGENLIGGDIRPPANQLKRLLQDNKTEVSAVPGAWRMIGMDTSRPPFDDLDVRKAVIAGFNRTAARQQRGGEALGPIAQHMINPGMLGFEESNGLDGWVDEMDWLASEDGDRAKSAEYFKAAGFDSGKFEGTEEILLVGDNAEPDRSIAQIAEQQLNEMGFKTNLRLVERTTMNTKFCGIPKSDVHVCPSLAWAADFPDPQSLLDPTFNGRNVLPAGNVNWAELDDPNVNKALEAAKLVTDPAERATAYAAANKAIMEAAPSIPYMWDYSTTVASPNVRAVQNAWTTLWDLNFTSIR